MSRSEQEGEVVFPKEECEESSHCKCLEVIKFRFDWKPKQNQDWFKFNLKLNDEHFLPIWLRVASQDIEAIDQNEFFETFFTKFLLKFFINQIPTTVIKIWWKIGPCFNLLEEEDTETNSVFDRKKKSKTLNVIEIEESFRTVSLDKPQYVQFDIQCETGRMVPPLYYKFEKLRSNGFLTDVKLVCEGNEFPCHSVVLAAMSPVFQVMFTGTFKESKDKTIHIQDFTKEELEIAVKFMYSHEENDIESHVPRLLAFADKYDIDVLRTACENSLMETLTSYNLVDILKLANDTNSKKLKRYILWRIQRNWQDFKPIVSLKNFLQIDVKTTIELLYLFE